MSGQMKDIVIVGAGGLGHEVQWLIERINDSDMTWNIKGYYDDGVSKGTIINDYAVLGTTDDLLQEKEGLSVVCAIGSSVVREHVINKIRQNKRLEFPNLIDPSVICSKRIAFGIGNVICAGNIMTTDIKLHDFCILNPGCTVGHDVELSSFVTLYPNANVSGTVFLGHGSEMGVASCIIQGRKVGAYSMVGAGAVVVRDIPENVVCMGVPAKVTRKRLEE